MSTTPTPSANKTSEAVEQLRKGSVAPMLYRRGVRVGIATKYQRMEEALKKIARDYGTDYVCQNVAKQALAFDPLAE